MKKLIGISCILILILLSACGGNSDEDLEEERKSTQPIQCNQCRK